MRKKHLQREIQKGEGAETDTSLAGVPLIECRVINDNPKITQQ